MSGESAIEWTDPIPLSSFRPGVIYKLIRIDQAEDCLRIGWMPNNALVGTHHGLWSVLMEWRCKCPMRVPVGRLY